MRFIINIIDKINEWVGKAVCLLLIPLVLITAYEVVMRYVVQRPTIWSWDLNIQIFAASQLAHPHVHGLVKRSGDT